MKLEQYVYFIGGAENCLWLKYRYVIKIQNYAIKSVIFIYFTQLQVFGQSYTNKRKNMKWICYKMTIKLK